MSNFTFVEILPAKASGRSMAAANVRRYKAMIANPEMWMHITGMKVNGGAQLVASLRKHHSKQSNAPLGTFQWASRNKIVFVRFTQTLSN